MQRSDMDDGVEHKDAEENGGDGPTREQEAADQKEDAAPDEPPPVVGWEKPAEMESEPDPNEGVHPDFAEAAERDRAIADAAQDVSDAFEEITLAFDILLTQHRALAAGHMSRESARHWLGENYPEDVDGADSDG